MQSVFNVLLNKFRLSLTDEDALESVEFCTATFEMGLFDEIEVTVINFDPLGRLLGCCSFGVGGTFR